MAINEQAPVVGRGEIEFAAAPELVWDVLTAIDRWPSWNPQVRSMDMQGGIETLDEALEEGLRHLKAEAERRTTERDLPKRVDGDSSVTGEKTAAASWAGGVQREITDAERVQAGTGRAL